MMTKPVVCRVLQEARGKSGEDLAAVVENDGASLAASNYELATIIPGDPPIACYRARVESPRSSVAALAERDEWRRTSPTDKTGPWMTALWPAPCFA